MKCLLLKMNNKQKNRVIKGFLVGIGCVMSRIFGTLYYVRRKSYRQVTLRLLHLTAVVRNYITQNVLHSLQLLVAVSE